MKDQSQIERRITELQQKLEKVSFELDKEMNRHYKTRNQRLLDFLYKENAVYQFALSELKEIIEDKELCIS